VKSAVWYEITKKRRKRRVYDPAYAQHLAYVHKRSKRAVGKKIALHKELRAFVEEHLLDDQSPEAIGKRLRRWERTLPYASPAVIRRFIESPYGRRIEARRKHILKHHSKRKRQGRKLKDRRTIDKRPKRIAKRHGLGHFEGDFIVSGRSGKGYVLGLTDRKVRKTLLELILPVSIRNVERALVRMKRRYLEMQTITFDNDLLFFEHKRLEKVLGITIYFCDTHSPWQKPGIENVNQRLRRYIPKGSDISQYSRTFIRRLEEKFNRRFMECLDSRTPDEAYALARKRKTRPSGRRRLKG